VTFAIVDTEKDVNQKVFYHLEINSDITSWKIYKRFSDFEALSNYLSNHPQLNGNKDFPLPTFQSPIHYTFQGWFSTNGRQTFLAGYMNKLV